MKTDPEKLCVKALAFELGLSTRFVYEMRRCGFAMEGRSKDNQTATLKQAVDWILENDFRMVDGFGVLHFAPENLNLGHRRGLGVQKSAKGCA